MIRNPYEPPIDAEIVEDKPSPPRRKVHSTSAIPAVAAMVITIAPVAVAAMALVFFLFTGNMRLTNGVVYVPTVIIFVGWGVGFTCLIVKMLSRL